MASLVLLNGPPGVGKTTLAERYLLNHPLALTLDIDTIRCSMGHWQARDESKHLARVLATEMARVHLLGGHHVVVPQLLARLDYIEVLDRVAVETGAVFHEILVLATREEALARFLARRQAFDAAGTSHPQATVEHDPAQLRRHLRSPRGDRSYESEDTSGRHHRARCGRGLQGARYIHLVALSVRLT